MPTTLRLCANGDHDGAVSIGISPSEAVHAASDSRQLPRWLFASGFATAVAAAGTAFYRSPHGSVVFDQYRFAYYATLAGIFVAGLAEVATACWLGGSSQPGRAHGRAFRASVICASTVPLAAIIALGGFSVVMKG